MTTRALLLENIHTDASARLAKEGYQVDTLARALGEDELIAAIDGVNLLGIRSGTQITERVLDAAPDLVAIGAFCIGVNQVDVAAASRRGVAVFNAPFSNTRSVVELALAEIIAMARRLPAKNAQMHEGQWDKSAAGSHEVRGRKIGIVGYGNIGTQLSVLAENLGMAVYFYDIADKLALGNARRCSTLTELLESVETVTLHVDGRDGNHGFFGADEFAAMRPRSLFLNLSRGFVVDHAALRRNIESGHIAGAAIDVFPEEPKGKGDEFVSELRGLPNVILTPHIGGSTEEAQQDIGEFVAGKLADYMASGATSLSVNLPEIALPAGSGTHRLVHLHQNVPGVLASINRVLAEHGVNVEGQLLRTRDEYGYVLTDIGSEYSQDVLAELSAMPVTIRLRTLNSPRGRPASQRRHVGTGDAAVDQERRGGDERGVVAGQERDRGGDLLRLGEPPHRHVHQAALRPLGVGREQLAQQRRVHRPRAQRVHPDALAGELHAEFAGQRQHAALGRGVGDLRGSRTHHRDERGGVHDGPATLHPHVADRFLAAQVDRGQVDLLDPAPGVQAGVQDRVVVGRGDPGVVERHVHRSEGDVCRAEGRGHVIRRRHVGVHEQAARLRRGLLPGRVVDVDRDHVRAVRREPPRGGQPDPAAGPGDDDGPALEPHKASVEMNTFLVSVNASGASGPSSRPRPDCLKPPNGVQ